MSNGDNFALNNISEECKTLIRLQRHDFLNHLQVIQGFLQLGKTDRALRYMEDIIEDVRDIEKLLAKAKDL